MFAVAYVLGVFAATGAVLSLARRLLCVSHDEPWEARSVLLAREVRAVAEDADERATARRRLVSLANRIEGHSRAAPPDADDRLRQCVHELGVECRKLGMERPRRSPPGPSLDALDEKADAVERAVTED
ncbi:hypothetical protein ACFQJD_07515 [Haloplanus sp. GCM10025708]|uniref:hypothetical protein n=1 Tax=Haloferacaceae TaxID=1644056 RepID=UPI00360A17A0